MPKLFSEVRTTWNIFQAYFTCIFARFRLCGIISALNYQAPIKLCGLMELSAYLNWIISWSKIYECKSSGSSTLKWKERTLLSCISFLKITHWLISCLNIWRNYVFLMIDYGTYIYATCTRENNYENNKASKQKQIPFTVISKKLSCMQYNNRPTSMMTSLIGLFAQSGCILNT